MHLFTKQPATLVVETKRAAVSGLRMHSNTLVACHSKSLGHAADFFLMEKKLEVTSYFAFVRGHHCIVEELCDGIQEPI